jgi:PhnB protein
MKIPQFLCLAVGLTLLSLVLETYAQVSALPRTCAQAFRYDEKHLGAKTGIMMTHGQSPAPNRVNPNWRDAVLHARIVIGDVELWAADIPKAEPMRSAYITLRMDSDSEAERVFSALSDGGQVLMPIKEELFAFRFGQVRDQFGINWMIFHERPMEPRT